jgi:hypothetical protein
MRPEAIIAEIAKRVFGSSEKMCECHGRSERSSHMTMKVQSRVKDRYGCRFRSIADSDSDAKRTAVPVIADSF